MVTLNWSGNDPDSGDTLSYTVYFDTVDGKQTPIDALSNINNQSVDVTVNSNIIYYWRVKTMDGQNSSFSIIYTFKTQ